MDSFVLPAYFFSLFVFLVGFWLVVFCFAYVQTSKVEESSCPFSLPLNLQLFLQSCHVDGLCFLSG